MTSSISSSRIGAGLAAVALPALVLLGVGRWLAPEPREAREPSAVVLALEEGVRAAQPEVLAVGNSILDRGVDEARVTERLGRSFHALKRPGAPAPLWYAMLENRVYAQGIEPRLVLVVGTFRSMASVELASEATRAALEEQLGEREPVLETKVFGQSPTPLGWERLRARCASRKVELLDLAKGVAVGLLFPPVPGEDPQAGLVAAGLGRAAPALERIFGQENAQQLDPDLGVMPVVEVRSEADAAPGTAAAQPIDASLIPDFVELVAEHGGQVVFVHLPILQEMADKEHLDRRARADLAAFVAARGAGFLDLQDVQLTRADFRDPLHLSEAGRVRVTEILADRLQALGVGAGVWPIRMPGPPPDLLLDPRVRRVGSPPGPFPLQVERAAGGCAGEAANAALSFLAWPTPFRFRFVSPFRVLEDGRPLEVGDPREEYPVGDCRGRFAARWARVFVSATDPAPHTWTATLDPGVDLTSPPGTAPALWLYPGTGLEVDLGPLVAGQSFGFRALARAFGPGEGVVVAQGTGGVAAAARQQADLVALAGEGVCAAEACRITLTAPDTAPYLAITNLDVSLGDTSTPVLGRGAELALRRSVRLLAPHGEVPVTRAGPLPAIPPLAAPRYYPGKDAYGYELPGLSWLAEDHVRAVTTLGLAAPLVVQEGGQALAPASCAEVLRPSEETRGRFCHRAEQVFVHPRAAPDARDGAAALSLAVDGERWRAGLWLFPGDRYRYSVPAWRLPVVYQGFDELHLRLAAFAPTVEAAPLHVRLLADEVPVFDAPLPAPVDRREELTLPLSAPVGSAALTLEIEAPPDGAWILLLGAELVEDLRE
jgi:hypothetical protein